MSEWQTIESAPKGPKIIGGYYNSLGKWRSIMARYYSAGTLEAGEGCEEDETGMAPEGWYEETETHSEGLLIVDCPLTHWMPCPGAPE